MKSISMALMMACGMSSAAYADPRLGSRLGPDLDRQYHSKASAEQQARIFVGCMVAHHRLNAAALLQATDKVAVAKINEAFGDETECEKLDDNETASVGAFQYPMDIFRGMVAETLLAPVLDQAASLPKLPVEKAYSRLWFAMSGRNPAVDSMAVCLAENAPSGVAGLLRTGSYTPAEMTALQALGPSLGQCLQANVKLQANRQTLRAAIAEGLYHRLMDPPAPVPAPAGK